MASLVLQQSMIERSQQHFAVVIIDDWAHDALRLNQCINTKVMENVERSWVDGGGARFRMDDVALVKQCHRDAGTTKHQSDDETDRAAARDDYGGGHLARYRRVG